MGLNGISFVTCFNSKKFIGSKEDISVNIIQMCLLNDHVIQVPVFLFTSLFFSVTSSFFLLTIIYVEGDIRVKFFHNIRLFQTYLLS